MTAGSIAVPTVIPLRPPIPGRPKTLIDSNTKIELRTETAGAIIHYTINGTKPDPFQRIGDRCTMKYHGPFTLPPGKQTVKAIAVASDGLRESNVVTKIFDVQYAPAPNMPPEDDDMGFQDDLERSQAKRDVSRAKTELKSKLMTSTTSAWTDMEELKTTQQRLADMDVRGSMKQKSYPGARFSEARKSGHLDNTGGYNTTKEQPFIFNGIGSQDLRWATQRLPPPPQDPSPPYNVHFDQGKYPRAQDFLNFTTTSAGQYPGANQWMPVNVSPSGFMVPAPAGMHNVGSGGDDLRKRAVSHSVSTQTVGLFYPSQRQIDKTNAQEEEKIAFEKQMRDRRPLLTAVSPGRGYWRKQIEHICQHLKAHTQNDAEFRALIAEPKMGKLLTSSVQEDGYELSLTLTFALRGTKDPFMGKQLGVSRSEGYLSAHTQLDSRMYSEDEESEEEIVTSRSGVKKVKKPKAKKKVAPKLSPENAKLFKELNRSGDVSVEELQEILDDGADANCVNKNELPALHVAVKNRHADAIAILVDSGADVNAKGPSSMKGNTALHETINLGPSGMKVIDALLSTGADQSIKNDRGETPYDLAIKAGYETISKRFASALGQSQLAKMTKMRSY